MRSVYLSSLLTFCLSLFIIIESSVIPAGIDDFEIAKKYYNFIEQPQQPFDNEKKSQGEIVYPRPNTTWRVGEYVNVTFKPQTKDQTVDIFFFNKTGSLAHGSLNEIQNFPFIVPPEAISTPAAKGTSLLLAVRRKNSYLQTVDSVVVKVEP
ncbi:hypothetical protein BDF20DRAFT_509127 [Mycotypha africana]|uniref:uncharacterized protein n=1 Tax=Mycotypha africana TaxID=64632 RepID=UPI002301584B|nr:uncharacterized protein BDF20DRAFT_509127 [Mycotypha africana]KAI8979479.1 hypothetical protein BDF20DRAFT_509127 [Mycotypha africana]